MVTPIECSHNSHLPLQWIPYNPNPVYGYTYRVQSQLPPAAAVDPL